jgi:SNF2 family DNA or RNA helicase
MFILHGSWLAASHDNKDRGFVLWAETGNPASVASEQPEGTLPRGAHHHPFAAAVRDLRRAVRDFLPSHDHLLTAATASAAAVRLPSTRSGPQTSPGLRTDGDSATPGKLKLAVWQVDAIRIPPQDILGLLAVLPGEDDETPGIRSGADLRFWSLAARLALEILAGQRYMPALVKEGGDHLALWRPAPSPADRERSQQLARAMPALCRAIQPTGGVAAKDAPTPVLLLGDFLAVTVDAYVRERADLDMSRFSAGGSVAEAWLSALVGREPQVIFPASSLDIFYDQYRAWAEPAGGVSSSDAFRLCFRLDPPLIEADTAGIRVALPTVQNWALRYFLQATDDPSLLVPAAAVWREHGSTAQFVNRTFDAPQERLLASLGHASRIFSPIDASLRTARPEECSLNVEQAYSFMREAALLLQARGFGVLVPNLAGKLGVRVRLRSKAQAAPKGGVSSLTFDSLVQYDWQISLGTETLSAEEFGRLAALKVPLVQIRGQWVELHPDQIEQALRVWQKHKAGAEISLQEALRLALGAQDGDVAGDMPVSDVVADGWINDLLKQLAGGEKMASVPPPDGFRGTLRPYQATGLSWLAFLRRWGLGGCLADDMGLGKTIQVIALLLHERSSANSEHRPALLVCPTSVVGNWQRELARFAPSLRTLAYRGLERRQIDLAVEAAQHDIVLTSYALLHRDQDDLGAVQWGDIILDEAQNIKNSSTKQAQAARKLPGQWRVALTGTPVENRLSELWSIFNFLNPGYLGSQEDFRKRLATPIERTGDAKATQALKSLVGPFILRRVKTDPSVITDLPQKNEMKVYCTLTKEQATLYQAVVSEAMERVASSDGIERRGIVLAMIMRLKQVCNHPAQFLADGSALPGRSGKLERLTEMLQEVRTVRERTLIFSQFAEMGSLLRAYLQEVFGDEVLFLHGGTPAKTRDKMVERFQNDPHGPMIFILSIKAGGTGLNLMRANHVFHFDRWWNPAVENQATDRAFRIGQTRNVQIYKYLCAGTFEEKIDDMIERKKALAASIVGSSEAWITELSTEQLRDVFTLRRDAVE